MNAKIEEGMAIEFRYSLNDDVSYGIVMSVGENYIDFIPVGKIGPFLKCYDDEGADEKRDKDNVRIKGCPPPFLKLCHTSELGIFAYANMDEMIRFNEDDCEKFGVKFSSDKVKSYMMDELRNHPWIDQPQKEKLRRRPLPDVPENIRSPQDDMQLE